MNHHEAFCTTIDFFSSLDSTEAHIIRCKDPFQGVSINDYGLYDTLQHIYGCVSNQTWKTTTPVPDSLSRLGKLGAGLACCRQASLPHFVSYYPLHHCRRRRLLLLRWTPDIRVPLGKLWPLLWQGLGAASRSGITNSFSGIDENKSVLTNIQSRFASVMLRE